MPCLTVAGTWLLARIVCSDRVLLAKALAITGSFTPRQSVPGRLVKGHAKLVQSPADKKPDILQGVESA